MLDYTGWRQAENTKRHQAHVEICKIESKGKDIGATMANMDKWKFAQLCAKRYGEGRGEGSEAEHGLFFFGIGL